jgi:hypothetical protein
MNKNEAFKYDGEVETEFWRFYQKSCSADDYENINDAVFGCSVIDFLAEKMDWGPGAVLEGMIGMDDFDPTGGSAEISVDIPIEIYKEYQDKIEEMLGEIEGALDDYAGGWSRNC